MSRLPEIEEIHRRRALAEACGCADAVAGKHASRKLGLRERFAARNDKSGDHE
jgi:hypothetical protein